MRRHRPLFWLLLPLAWTIAIAGAEADPPAKPADNSPPKQAAGDAAPKSADAIDAMLGSFRDAIDRQDADRIVAHLSIPRFTQEVNSHEPFVKSASLFQRLAFVAKAAQEARRKAVDSPERFTWARHQVRSVTPLKDGNEAIAVVRFWLPGGESELKRLWLIQQDGSWQIYDVERVFTPGRTSTQIAELGARGMGNRGIGAGVDPFVSQQSAWMAAERALAEGDFGEAESLLRGIPSGALTPDLEAKRWVSWGQLKHATRSEHAALECYRRARKANPDLAAIDLGQAGVLNDLGLHARALEIARHCEQLVSPCAETSLEIGNALAGLRRFKEAAAAYRQSLDDDPDSLDSLLGLGIVLPVGKKQELAERFLKLSEPVEWFPSLVVALQDAKEIEASEIIVEAFRKLAPNDPLADYYAAQAKLLRGQGGEAAAMLKDAILRLPRNDDNRSVFVELCIEGLLMSQSPLEAYRQAPDAPTAFRLVADKLVSEENEQGLIDLINLHRDRHCEDVWVDYYAAQRLLLRHEFEQARKLLSTALDIELDFMQEGRFRRGLYEAYCREGKSLEAYRKLDSPDRTFASLAQVTFENNDAAALEALATARLDDEQDVSATYWLAVAKWMRKDYEGVISVIKDAEAELTPEDSRRHREDLNDLSIRALGRTKQHSKARELAKSWLEEQFDPWYVAVACALSGDLKATDAAFEHCLECGYSVLELYEDEDIGPVLRTKEFADLREKYPDLDD